MRSSLFSVAVVTVALASACAGRSVGGIDDGTTDAGARPDASTGDGGPTTDGGKRGSPCAGAPVAIELTSTSGAAFCVGQNDCTNVWLTILRADRTPLTTGKDCIADCDQCVAVGCTGQCPASYPMPAGGLKGTWSGTYYTNDLCGAERMQCALPQCAAPGKYIARMCVYRATSDAGNTGMCQGSPAATCTEVAFDWPTAGPVRGTVN